MRSTGRLAALVVLATAGSAVAADPPAELTPYREFAARVEEAVRAGEKPAFADLFDKPAFLERTFRGLKVPDDFRSGFGRGAGDVSGRLFGEYANVVRQGGSFKLLRVRKVEGEHRALFRVLNDGALNYSDFVLTPAGRNGPKVADIHIALSGEMLSRTVGRLAAKAALEVRGKAVGIEDESGVLANIEPLLKLPALVRAKKSREALAVWEKLPDRLKKDKAFALLRLAAALQLMDEDPDVYRAAIEDHLKRFPDDPAADMVGLDAHILRKNYAECYRALERIDRSVGGDPYLLVLRGNVLNLEGKPADARKAAEKAVAAEPDLVPAYWTLVDAALVTEDHKETARLLTLIEKKFEIEIHDLTAIEAYRGFVKSPEYRAWQAGRKQRPPAR